MRTRRAVPAATTAALLLAAAAAPAAGQPVEPDGLELTLLATTDVHGHVYDWDYFRNQPFPEDDSLGLTRVSTVVDDVREEKGAESVVVVDNGDAIQGTPLTYYYGMGDGAQEVLDDERTHPMAAAFNHIGYDVQTVGNHEYNYGLDMLDAYEEDLDFPLLGANVLRAGTDEPYHEPYELVERTIDGENVTVGVIGLVTPGVRIWDQQHVEGVLEFQDMVTAAERWVPVVEEQADVVVVIAHTGLGNVENEDYDPAALHEDVTNNIAHFVPGIDVLVAGHTHQDIPSQVLENVDGEPVLMTQPSSWARSVTETTLNLVPEGEDGWEVDWSEGQAPTAVAHYGTKTEEDPELVELLADEHAATVDYVNTPVAQSVTELPAATSRYEDTPIIDFINHVQQTTVEAALEGTEHADATVISQASPFSRTAVFPEGEVTIRDIAGLYIYENTLRAVELTGAQLRDYLEYSARYFNQVEEGAEFDPETGTNAVYPDRPEGVPDYNYDVISGLEYSIDISQPVGERITGLSHPDGTPVADDDVFVMAVNNYRQSGGGAFPHVADAPVVYDELLEIRQLLIEWAQERGVIDPADFFVENWWLVTEPLPEPEPTTPGEEPTEEPSPTTAPTSPDATAPPTAGPGGGQLPATGAPVVALAGLALLTVLGGAGALAHRRRMAP
ncbi:2',3'-cyclic-nucleotide 2'-phosphodiesterase / 3'-nucleotidase [Georgenia satyanarayanai]|uniref:2',3'-cyclic-nucleotide 2'-phosphodiesterase / 3'-nucleotidase n=1 Tax=Georgenia satyanarayanai TaxID=860221 RepID=A0A2Y9A4L9_9MICO|nr:5'-nucleotidase C-terminal domain-containing protein [Georgenia satyanarayanai]PYG01125.1 2',3'-cyclic-nucleotide 2'-phosphodiesterase/3'-nucleotidase [Georgenia satyanarayanai]SSA39364.1 2',3'-cyclic-nucleotide 2'-phosphodiesterase / 3'-nucleotidase [Georgenia satyanarayanai]